ncbi:MAG: 2-phospho-L-lactate guanylyltransferase [Actinomycetota bacterium]|nr:2-phospho-L-lactate guanylyltransferase [Actinomycetota bacterium]
MKATAILPVKRFSRSMTRLDDRIGPPARAALLKAMLGDMLVALERTTKIERIVVVSGEGRAEKVAMEAAKRGRTPIEVLRDPDDRGHSEAATLGIVRAKALGAECVALLPGDCPLLEPAELNSCLKQMAGGRVAVIPDRHGSGTNGLLMSPCDAIGPAFGEGSCERHLDRAHRAGWGAVAEPIASLGLDLDTPEDLEELAGLLEGDPGRAPRTADALKELERR